MTLRWISDVPPAIVFANDTKKLVIQRPPLLRAIRVESPRRTVLQMSMPISNAALPDSDVAIFMNECSGADEPCANDEKPL